MVARYETNVRVLPCVLEALNRIVARRGLSRDETVRQVLAEHVTSQETCSPEDRLTHISTVLRHPAPAWRGQQRVDRPLRLRLPEGLAERAREVSLRLPGQYQRAHKDYVARQLTDAVVTAIAVNQPFTDDILDGLLPVLRHNAALGLWQLAVAVTSTRPERAIQDAAEYIRARPPGTLTLAEKRLLLVSEQLDEEVSWHAPFRFDAAASLARTFLRGNAAETNENMLYQQGNEWNEVRLDLRHDRNRSRWIQDVAPWDASGRGSTTVWRAERKVEVQDFTDWLLTLNDAVPRSREMNPPGWTLRMPAEWETYVVPRGRELPTRFARWAAVRQVLVVSIAGQQVVWPLRPGHQRPVPGIEPLAATAGTLPPQDIGEFLEAILIEWGTPPTDARHDVLFDGDDGEDPYDASIEAEQETPQLWLPVDKAFEFGFVDADQRRIAMAAAHQHTQSLPHWRRTSEPVVAKPEITLDPEFQLLVTRRRTGRTAKPMWRWPRSSVVREVVAGTSPDVVGWLADRALWTARRTLHGVMEQTWHDGFDHHPLTFWRPGAIPDDDLV